jgi:hypothetical protein
MLLRENCLSAINVTASKRSDYRYNFNSSANYSKIG